MADQTPCDVGFRLVGSPAGGVRRPCAAAPAFQGYAECRESLNLDEETYLSAFQFTPEFTTHVERTGSTAGYPGMCGSSVLWLDVDRPDLGQAHTDAKAQVGHLTQNLGVRDDDLMVFCSGSKGFHIGIRTGLWKPEPSLVYHEESRIFAEGIAAEAGVQIDTSIYKKVQPFRAPNTRHPKTGLYKRYLTVKEVLGLTTQQVIELATRPHEFDWDFDRPVTTNQQLVTRWQAAQLQLQQTKRAYEQADDAGEIRVHRRTVDFIRRGAPEGERNNRLFSAARNLAECGVPEITITGLLEESARDSGLPPREIQATLNSAYRAGRN